MTTVLMLLPLLAVIVLGIVLLSSTLTLWTRYQHPRLILLRTISAASMLAIVGYTGVVPDWLWWAPWLLTLALAAGAVVACRRLLVSDPPSEPTTRQAKHLAAPHPMNLAVELIMYLALLTLALLAG